MGQKNWLDPRGCVQKVGYDMYHIPLGDAFEVSIDGKHVCNFAEMSPKNVQNISYEAWENRINTALARH